ncbi:hypothetical protein PTKIN_Ptkin04bG0049000 [Pterospermum kingtungense]
MQDYVASEFPSEQSTDELLQFFSIDPSLQDSSNQKKDEQNSTPSEDGNIVPKISDCSWSKRQEIGTAYHASTSTSEEWSPAKIAGNLGQMTLVAMVEGLAPRLGSQRALRSNGQVSLSPSITEFAKLSLNQKSYSSFDDQQVSVQMTIIHLINCDQRSGKRKADNIGEDALGAIRVEEHMSRPGDWNCRLCQHLNFQRRDSCQRCGESRLTQVFGGTFKDESARGFVRVIPHSRGFEANKSTV